MITYIIIGAIVCLLIRIERTILRPEMWDVDWKSWFTWLILLIAIVLDTMLWPLAVICEVIAIIYRHSYQD